MEEPAKITEPAILLCINRLYSGELREDGLYDVARGVWAASNERRRSRVKLAFAVFRDTVRAVYQVFEWHRAGTTPYSSGRTIDKSAHKNDWEFTGAPAPSEIRNKYVANGPRAFGEIQSDI